MGVGGQRNERKKWIHASEDVKALLFCASMSCYNEMMFEDETKNKMEDQLELFSQVTAMDAFAESVVILLLTKRDLFETKIQRIPLTNCGAFTQYAGIADSYEDGVAYVKERFKEHSRHREPVVMHVVNATDKSRVEKVFADCVHFILD